KKDQEELIHLISNYSKISLYQHHLTKSRTRVIIDCYSPPFLRPLVCSMFLFISIAYPFILNASYYHLIS
ncbi:TPA: hypothetical protein ACGV2C_002415, partial [Enterococcus faecium]